MQATSLRGATGRTCAPMASARPADQPRQPPQASPAQETQRSRRSVLLGLGASLVGLASAAGSARAAATRLSDLVRPVADALDANRDGMLDVDELRGAVQRRMGITLPRERVVAEVMAPVDFDDDGNVTVDEFARGLSLDLGVDERWMRTMGSGAQGQLSLEQLAEGLGDLGETGRNVLPVAFDMADADRDGLLSAAEAANAMRYIAAGVLGEGADTL